MPSTLERLSRRDRDLFSSRIGAVPEPAPDRFAATRGGIRYTAATRIEDVVAAWRLVYEAYMATGLIDPNDFEVHFVEQAIQPRAVVGLGRVDGVIRATISAYADGPRGLPLDCVYRRELDELRVRDRHLVEVGLLADRSSDRSKALDTSLSLMRIGFFHGIHLGATDLVIGVHPHHARFYERLFGFRVFGEPSTCPIVNGAPVVGLRLDLVDRPMPDPLPRGLRFFVESPLCSDFFEARLRLRPEMIRRTALEGFLNRRALSVDAAIAP